MWDQGLEKFLILQDWGNSKSLPLDTKWSFILSRLVNNGILGKWAEIKNGQSLHFKVNKMGQKVKKSVDIWEVIGGPQKFVFKGHL